MQDVQKPHPQDWTSEPKDALIPSTAREGGGMYVEKIREPEDEASNVHIILYWYSEEVIRTAI